MLTLSIPNPISRRKLLGYRLQKYEEQAMNLYDELQQGNISVLRWQVNMKQELKDLHVTSAIIGKGGDMKAMTQSDWGWVGAKLRWQYVYLDKLTQEMWMRQAFPSNMKRRLQMYGEASRHVLEHYIGLAGGYPNLPYEPGDGSTVCLSGCKCHWSVKRMVTSSGRVVGWLVSWVMSEAEHCVDCVRRTKEWSNTFVRSQA